MRSLTGRVPAPALRLFTCTAEESWLLTDAVPGLTGDAWLARSPDALPQVVRGCAALMRRLHALPVDTCPFDAGHRVRLAEARANVAAGLVVEDDFDAEHRGWSAAAVLAKAKALASFTPERVVTHGDFSLGNILFDAGGVATGLIDVGRAGVTDPYQDIAILWRNSSEFSGTEMLLAELGIVAVDEARLAFHSCLDELL